MKYQKGMDRVLQRLIPKKARGSDKNKSEHKPEMDLLKDHLFNEFYINMDIDSGNLYCDMGDIEISHRNKENLIEELYSRVREAEKRLMFLGLMLEQEKEDPLGITHAIFGAKEKKDILSTQLDNTVSYYLNEKDFWTAQVQKHGKITIFVNKGEPLSWYAERYLEARMAADDLKYQEILFVRQRERINILEEDLSYWFSIGGEPSEENYIWQQIKNCHKGLNGLKDTIKYLEDQLDNQLVEEKPKTSEKMDFWLINDLKYRLDGLTYKNKEGQVVTKVMTYEEMEKYLEGIDILYQRKEISLKTFIESSLAVLARMKNFSTERVIYRDIPSIEDMDTGVKDEYESFLKKWKTFNKVNIVESSSLSIKEDEIIASVDREKAISRRWRRLKKNLVWRAKDLNFEIIVKAARLQASIGDILSAKKGKKAYIS